MLFFFLHCFGIVKLILFYNPACPLSSRIHYWPIGQQRYILSCHQSVQHGWCCHFHGLADGYPQQHRALRQLRRRPCKDLFVFPAPAWQRHPPSTPRSRLSHQPQPNPIYQNQYCAGTCPLLRPPPALFNEQWNTHIRPDSCFVEESSFALLWIHWDCNTFAATMHCGYHHPSSLSCITVPPVPFLSLFCLANVYLHTRLCCQIPASVRFLNSPLHECSRTLLLTANSCLFISDPVFKALLDCLYQYHRFTSQWYYPPAFH